MFLNFFIKNSLKLFIIKGQKMKIETKFNIKDQVYFAELDLYHPRTQIDPFTINGIKIDENYRIFYLYNYCDRSGDSFIEEIEQKYVFLTYEEALLGSKLLFENMIREEVSVHEQK